MYLAKCLLFCKFILKFRYIGNFVETEFGYRGVWNLEGQGQFGNDAEILSLFIYGKYYIWIDVDIYLETENRAHVKIYDPSKTYFKIPDIIQIPEITTKVKQTNYDFLFPASGGFILRRGDEIIFDVTTGNDHFPLTFEDGFIRLCSTINKQPIVYGLGERRTRYSLGYPFNYTMNNQDRNTPADGTKYFFIIIVIVVF